MKRYIGCMALIFFLAALVIGIGAKAAEKSALDDIRNEVNYTQVIEDTDIMAKVIDKALSKIWPKKYKGSTMFRQFLGCQGVYLKDYGALFVTNINFPVAERKLAKSAKELPDDLWQQVKKELKGDSNMENFYKQMQKNDQYDAKRAGKLKEELLRLAGEYGGNMRHLGDGENVVIIVRGESQGDSLYVAAQPFKNGSTGAKVRVFSDSNFSSGHAVGKMGNYHYDIAAPDGVDIEIKDADENVIRTIEAEENESVEGVIHWDGENDEGEEVEPGEYTYEIKGEDHSVKGKIVIDESGASGQHKKHINVVVAEKFNGDNIVVTPEEIEIVQKIVRNDSGDVEITMSDEDGPKTFHIRKKESYGMSEDMEELEEVIKEELQFRPKPWPGGNVRRTTMIVKVSKADIMAYKDGSIEFGDFAKRAEITQY